MAVAIALAASTPAFAQTPTYPNMGRSPTAEEIGKWDIAIGPSGKELPQGRGTAIEGTVVYYARRCIVCHGPALEGTQYGPRLAGGTSEPARTKTIGSYWPFATTLWDYINRAMPRTPYPEGSLTANEVYALTAFVLYKNDVIRAGDVVDERSLPAIRMPNRDGFFPKEPDWTWYQRECRLGRCRPRMP